MTLDLAPRIFLDTSAWYKPGQLFICKEKDWFDAYDGIGVVHIIPGDVVFLIKTRCQKISRKTGSELYATILFLIEDKIYRSNTITADVKTKYTSFVPEDKIVIKKSIENKFEPMVMSNV